MIQRIQSFAAEKGPGAASLYSNQCELGTDEFHGPYRTGDRRLIGRDRERSARLVTRLSTPSDEIDNQPVASGSVLGSAVEGLPVMLSCSGSSTIGSIDARFDLDGQNEFCDCLRGWHSQP